MNTQKTIIQWDFVYAVIRVHHDDYYSDANVVGLFRNEENAIECALEDISENWGIEEEDMSENWDLEKEETETLALFLEVRSKKKRY